MINIYIYIYIYETATTLWYSPTVPDKLSAALITKAQP